MRHLLRRLGFYLVALWASLTANFILPRLAPGDPASVLVANMQGKANPQQLRALKELLGVTNESLWLQYVHYLGNLLRGDLGISTTYFPAPVGSVIGQALPWTLALVGVATVISFTLGTLIGALVAWKRDSTLDSALTPLLTFLSAIPYFWLALLLLYILGYSLKWFPLDGAYDAYHLTPDLSGDFLASVLQHAFLPVLAIVLSSIAGWLLAMRNAMVTTLSEDYVLLAQAKGLAEWRVVLRYAARNAVLPSVTGFALSLGFVISGSLLTEIVFSYPGVGFILLTASQHKDYPLMQGIFLLIAVTILASNFLADLVYVYLDPRVRHERG
jgi:peptide/nickel transport system permease protein